MDSVQSYQMEFEKLAQGLLLYNNAYDDTYFVNHFVDGLKDEIRSVISLHRPKDVDTASALALLQEEELAKCKKFGSSTKFYTRPNVDRPKSIEADRVKGDSQFKENEDKLAALKESRRKNGLCFKCGAKWSHNHKCVARVPLHVLEEILDALESDSELSAELEDDIIATVSQSNSLEQVRRRTMRICGCIGKVSVLILVDSDSVGSFISDRLAAQLQLATVPCTPVHLMVADGSPMICDQKIPDLQWSAQGHTFFSSMGIIPLKCFDMIIGADWLEDHSPMWVHWGRKIMRFTSARKRVTLLG